MIGARVLTGLGLFAAALLMAAGQRASGQSDHSPPTAVDFQRDVRPILSRHCFKCHGPDDKARKANLRLDRRDGTLHTANSGFSIIDPGHPERSELVRRVSSEDQAEVMPPPEAKNPLLPAQQEALKRWIAAGAEYTTHWAFVPPERPPLPPVRHTEWPRNPIDYYVLARLELEGLEPSARADRFTLVRRLYLDLLGFPPSPEEADEFVRDDAPDAYEKLVDRLLDSPHYGERWARRWLDLARYADTNGYEKDRPRSIWPYRDWVIRSINEDMPFDQFTIEQIAGDMLPHATTEQQIATGFHRNTMLNEEGGIDPLEFRFHAMTDRVGTTAKVWLGLTLGCAQCHTHKFDPITQREYYQFMAFLNNADEPELDVPVPEVSAQRKAVQSQIAARIAELPEKFPVDAIAWLVPPVASVVSAGGAKAEALDDGSVRFTGHNPERDSYTLCVDTNSEVVSLIRLEAMADPTLPQNGPGRPPHGNFVVSEIKVWAAPKDAPDQAVPVKLSRAEADFSQNGFGVERAIDGDLKSGWAIHGEGNWNVTRTATFALETPISHSGGTRFTVQLDQHHGQHHTLGRLRLSVGRELEDPRPIELRRREQRERKFQEWIDREAARAVRWTELRPVQTRSNLPLLSILDDNSVLASGDQSKSDTYELCFRSDLAGITAIRLEVLPDDRLPKHGPGRVYYEGPFGDFFLCEFTVTAGGEPAPIARASHSFADGKSTAEAAIDGSPQTGWSINGGQGRPHMAVFNLASPLAGGQDFSIRMLFEKYFSAGLGRFRISVTSDAKPAEASALPRDLDDLLTIPVTQLTAAQRDRLFEQYLRVAPELAAERAAIDALRKQLPAVPTTLVMAERPRGHPRATHIHDRGEFLQPTEPVQPAVLSVLPPLSQDAPPDRLGFARWLVSSRNPLTARVTMNRHWATLFGRGIVRTVEDFGFQGELPSHPELLDWLAVELVEQGWSLKRMHKLMVTSATYQQSSRLTPGLLQKDPENRLLGRGPRVRLEAEQIRDSSLRISGLLAAKLGGPSVFPPQPSNVTTEGAYGQLNWKVSEGPDRYRRGLYTFSKRTVPYAMFSTFDAPSGEACVAQRESSNSPLQALTLLNDPVFLEAAQALGRMLAARSGPVDERAEYLFRRCFTRPPSPEEQAMLVRFYETQKRRLEEKQLDAAAIAGAVEQGEVNERAAWTVLARTLLSLDEAITKS